MDRRRAAARASHASHASHASWEAKRAELIRDAKDAEAERTAALANAAAARAILMKKLADNADVDDIRNEAAALLTRVDDAETRTVRATDLRAVRVDAHLEELEELNECSLDILPASILFQSVGGKARGSVRGKTRDKAESARLRRFLARDPAELADTSFLRAAVTVSAAVGDPKALSVLLESAMRDGDAALVRAVIASPAVVLRESDFRIPLCEDGGCWNAEIFDALLAASRGTQHVLPSVFGSLLRTAASCENPTAVQALLLDGRADTAEAVSAASLCFLLHYRVASSTRSQAVFAALVQSRHFPLEKGIRAAIAARDATALRLILASPCRARYRAEHPAGHADLHSALVTDTSYEMLGSSHEMLDVFLDDPYLLATEDNVHALLFVAVRCDWLTPSRAPHVQKVLRHPRAGVSHAAREAALTWFLSLPLDQIPSDAQKHMLVVRALICAPPELPIPALERFVHEPGREPGSVQEKMYEWIAAHLAARKKAESRAEARARGQ